MICPQRLVSFCLFIFLIFLPFCLFLFLLDQGSAPICPHKLYVLKDLCPFYLFIFLIFFAFLSFLSDQGLAPTCQQWNVLKDLCLFVFLIFLSFCRIKVSHLFAHTMKCSQILLAKGAPTMSRTKRKRKKAVTLPSAKKEKKHAHNATRTFCQLPNQRP